MVLFRRLLGDVLRCPDAARHDAARGLRRGPGEPGLHLRDRARPEGSVLRAAGLALRGPRPAALRRPPRGLRRRRGRGGRDGPGRRARRSALPARPATWSPPPPDPPVAQAQPRAGSSGTSRSRARGRARPASRPRSACRTDGTAPVAAVDPHPLALAQVAGRGLDRPLLVDLEHQLRRGGRGGAGRSTSPTELAGCTPLVKQSSAMYMLPMPARLVWSSSASADRAVGLGAQPASASSSSQSGPSRSGPRWPDEIGLLSRGTQLDDAEREADRHASLDGEHHPSLVGGAAPPLPGVDVPGALHLQVGVERPGRSVVDAGEQVLAARDRADDGAAGEVEGGVLRHAEVGGRQDVAGEGAVERAAARKTVSPSGTQPQPLRSGHESRCRERVPQGRVAAAPSSATPSAFSTASRPSAPRRADSARAATAGVSMSTSSLHVSRVRPRARRTG